jgi:hypothetical protein
MVSKPVERDQSTGRPSGAIRKIPQASDCSSSAIAAAAASSALLAELASAMMRIRRSSMSIADRLSVQASSGIDCIETRSGGTLELEPAFARRDRTRRQRAAHDPAQRATELARQ